MKKQIWKFEINKVLLALEMPKGAEILTVQTQDGDNAFIWAIVDPFVEKELRHFEAFPTGQNINIDTANIHKYIGTFQITKFGFVYHLFEKLA